MRVTIPKRLRPARLKSRLRKVKPGRTKLQSIADNAAAMVETSNSHLLSRTNIMVAMALCLFLWCLNAFFLTSATVTVMLLPREQEAKEEKAEGVAISSARTLATIYLIDKKLDKAEDFEI